jgi:hypothetical protein
MSMGEGIQVLMLQEFRLAAPDADGSVARIVGSSARGVEPPVPLLTSIADRCDVAMIRALHAGESVEHDSTQRSALDPFVSTWGTPTVYAPRITERSDSPPSHYRLAVTESGINEPEAETQPVAIPEARDATSTHLGLLWIGQPVGTHAGLLILLGSDGGSSASKPPAREWPLPLSKYLGVRIYEGM